MTGYIVGPTLAPGESPFRDGWEWDDEVATCVHPEWESVLLRPRPDRIEECIRCVACHAPRCGHAVDDDPCMRIRHHGGNHVLLSGGAYAVGGTI